MILNHKTMNINWEVIGCYISPQSIIRGLYFGWKINKIYEEHEVMINSIQDFQYYIEIEGGRDSEYGCISPIGEIVGAIGSLIFHRKFAGSFLQKFSGYTPPYGKI